MNWLNGQTINWEAPEYFATRFARQDMALLYSSLADQESGASSYLALMPLEVHEGSDWAQLEKALASPINQPHLPDWIGYLGYGMRDSNSRAAASPLHLPDYRIVRYGHLFHFHHPSQTLTHHSRAEAPTLTIPSTLPPSAEFPSIAELHSNMSRAEYEAVIERTLERISAGAFYQANITRKFYGQFLNAPSPLDLFFSLTRASPAAYSAYIHHAGSSILSASPESFLNLSADGRITSRPIKGSARRSENEGEDIAIRNALLASDKNNAENLMIVDLMRNDIARVAEPQSVEVSARAALHSYSTIHHLISAIHGQKRQDKHVIDALRACFPPGSMTGAPKRAAIDWCCQQEPMERGVYSGAIGWLNAERCDLSVVIRTLVMEGNRFEFQVGGGIVADSTPEDEWRETLTKARGICSVLGISEGQLAAL